MTLQRTALQSADEPPHLVARKVVAFLDDSETAATLRELCRVRKSVPPRVQGGGLGAALEHHDLIGDVETVLVDIDSSLMPDVDIAALRTVVPAEMRIVTIGASADAHGAAELYAAGADCHLVKPVSADTLADELFAYETGAEEPDEPAAPAPVRVAPVTEQRPSDEEPVEIPAGVPRRIVVLGAHNGVGATSLAVNLAALIGRDSGEETLLLDLDLQFGTALLLLNRQPSTALGHMLREPSRIDRVLIRHAAQDAGNDLSVIGAEESLSPMAPIATEAMATLLDQAGDAFHNLVIDLPPHRLELLAPCLASATDIVLVSDFTLAGVRDVWRMQYEIERHAPASARRHLVIGGAVDAGDKVMSLGEFEHNTGMKVAARLPHDAPASGQASAAGKPVALTKPQSRIGKAYVRFAADFLPAPRKRGLFGLFRT